MTQTVTLELPESLYRLAHQVAEASGQPLEVVLQAGIAHALPPLDDVSPEEAASLAQMALLDDAALWQEARAMMSGEEQAALEDLLERQGSNLLSPPETSRLESLLERYGQLTVRKAHAWLLLARRGYQVPMQQNQV